MEFLVMSPSGFGFLSVSNDGNCEDSGATSN